MERRSFIRNSLIASIAVATPDLFKARVAFARSAGSVIVIGAGMSGVAAAQQLSASGFDVTILEGRSRIGGRTFTDTSLGASVDLGGAWIEGVIGNPLTALTQQFGIATYPDVNEFPLYDERGRVIAEKQVESTTEIYDDIIDRIYENAAELDNKTSFGSLLEREIARGVDSGSIDRAQLRIIRYLIDSAITGDIAADPKYISGRFVDDDYAFKGAQHLIPGGYVQLINNLISGITVKTDQIVERIIYTTSGVVVFTNQGEFSADRVLVTLPLGVLKNGAVKFDPVLPSKKIAAIRRLDMALLNKVVMRFPGVFWDSEYESISGFGNTRLGGSKISEISNFINLQPVVGAPILLGIFGGDFSKRSELLSDGELTALAMLTLRRIFGSGIAEPEAVVRTRWRSDPFSFGSYSFIPVGAFAKDREVLGEPIGERVFFAGEATNRRYPATVHGAYLSGVREASRIAAL